MRLPITSIVPRMSTMPLDAVIFDLFGTLVEPYVRWPEMIPRLADLFGVSRDAFNSAWSELEPGRDRGEFDSTSEAMERCATMLGVAADGSRIAAAVALKHESVRRALHRLRPDAIATLMALRAMGLKLGLISDCSADVPELWHETPLAPLLDAAVFSCDAKVTKPDPSIYLRCCRLLGVVPRDCLYVGDGGSNELAGAGRAGMMAILLSSAGDNLADAHRLQRQSWDGKTITALTDLRNILEGRTA